MIDQIFIHEQLGFPREWAINVANATFDKAKTVLRKITSAHAFVENEQWSVVHMKEEFHAKFVASLQVIYQ